MTKTRKEIYKRPNRSVKKPNTRKREEDYADDVEVVSTESSGVTITLKELKEKSPEEMQAQAELLEIENVSSLLKQELIFSILKKTVAGGGQIFGEGVLEILPDGFGFCAHQMQIISQVLMIYMCHQAKFVVLD